MSNFQTKKLDVQKDKQTPLDVARSYIGWREDGTNRGAIVRASLAGCMRDGRPLGVHEGVPWCAGFVGLCDFEAHAQYTWRAAVHELVSDAALTHLWHEFGEYVPRPGDLAIFKRGGKDPRAFGEGHVEFVEVAPDSSGLLTTIGGNVNDAVVRRVWRIGEESRGNELVGWICRTGITKEDRAQVDLAQRNLLREAAEVMISA